MDIAAKTAKAMMSAKMEPFVLVDFVFLVAGPTKIVPRGTNAVGIFVFHCLKYVRIVLSAIAQSLVSVVIVFLVLVHATKTVIAL